MGQLNPEKKLTPDQELRRGEQARQVIENEIYVEAWQKLRDGIIHMWETCPIRDKEGQHELKLELKLLKEVRHHLETTMNTGKMAKIQIERDSMFKRTVERFK